MTSYFNRMLITIFDNNKYLGKHICDVFLHTCFDLLKDHYLQKLSGKGMAMCLCLATFSSWLSVDQPQMPAEQVSW